MLDVIGAGAAVTSTVDWYDIWKRSPEATATVRFHFLEESQHPAGCSEQAVRDIFVMLILSVPSVNPNSATTCQSCLFRTTDEFLDLSFNIKYSNRRRDVGIFIVFITFNPSDDLQSLSNPSTYPSGRPFHPGPSLVPGFEPIMPAPELPYLSFMVIPASPVPLTPLVPPRHLLRWGSASSPKCPKTSNSLTPMRTLRPPARSPLRGKENPRPTPPWPSPASDGKQH